MFSLRCSSFYSLNNSFMKSRSVANTISDVFLWFNFQTGNLTGLRCRVKTQRAVVKIVPDRSQTSSYISWTSQLSATLANMALSGRGVSTLRVSLVPWLTTSAEAKRSPSSWGLVCTASRAFEELEPHIIWKKPLHTKPQPRSLTIKKSVTLVQCSILLKRNLRRAFIRISVIITSLFDALGNLCNEVI